MSRKLKTQTDIRSYFEQLTDSRRRELNYPLEKIVVILLRAAICG